MLVFLALLAAASPAIPPVAPSSVDQSAAETWTFQRVDRVTRSSPMGFSTDWRLRGRVVLHRAPDGSVTVEDIGESQDRVWDQTYGRRVETTTWRTSWSGTWRTDVEADVAALTLQRTGWSCEVARVRDRTPTELEPCPEGPSEQRLLCRLTEQWLGPELTTPGEERAPVGAWECVRAEVLAASTETPAPWTFGQRACVEASRGNTGARLLRLCGAAAD
ncbi:MAG: hypothetical protein JXX28_01820 [Deltaproteobacteria bacterium]|nr:hypothetical protein [Deltaproteobacteria bacterium]